MTHDPGAPDYHLARGAGGGYGRFVQKSRLLDKDAFWVFATP
jgi:hypothetical protein